MAVDQDKEDTDRVKREKEHLLSSQVSQKRLGEIKDILSTMKKSTDDYFSSLKESAKIRADAAADEARNTQFESLRREAKNTSEGRSSVEGTIDSISKASPKLGGLGIGLGALGLGIGGFFMGLSGAEAIMDHFGTGENLKKMIINLGDGLSSLDAQSLAALGTLVAGSALFAANTSFGKQIRVPTGMFAVGAGIGGFFAGLALADSAMSWVSTDTGALKNQMINLADGLAAFSGRDLTALGGLLTGSALFATNTSLGTQFKAATGMTLLGAGIGGFFAGLTGVTDLAAFLGADGEGIKNMMVNIAEGLNAFSGQSLGALGALLGTGALFGLAGPVVNGMAAVGMTMIGVGLAGFLSAFSGIGDIASYLGADGSGAKVMMINLAEGLKSFIGVDSKAITDAAVGMAVLSPALLAFFGSQGISSVLDTITSFITWATGSDDPITTVVAQLRKFESIDTSKLENTKGIGIGSILTDIASGLSAFSEAQFDASVLGVLTNIANWFSGNDTPFDAIAKLGEKADLLTSAASAIERIAEAMKKFAEIPSSANFDFDQMAKQLASAVPLFDAVLHGGPLNDSMFGFDTVIEKGLLDPDFNLDAGIDAINKVKRALSEVYDIEISPSVNIAPAAEVTLPTTKAVNTISTNAVDMAISSRGPAGAPINYAPMSVNNNSGGNVNSSTTNIVVNPSTGLDTAPWLLGSAM